MRSLPIYTNSSITAFRRCPREYYFRYVLLRKTRKRTEAMRFGSFFHVGLNAWWTWSGDATIRLCAGIDAMRLRAQNVEDSDPFELAKAEELLTGYTARWMDQLYETVAVEMQFKLTLPQDTDTDNFNSDSSQDFELAGAIDALVYCKSGYYRTDMHIFEHKTTASDIGPGAPYWQNIVALDPQVSTYTAAAKALGYEPRDVIYDVIRKPGIVPLLATPEADRKYTKPTKAEPIPRLYAKMRETDETVDEYRERLRADIIAEPEKYFQRMTIVRLERDHAQHAEDVWQTAQMIAVAVEREMWPRSPNACERYGRLCEFHDVCSGITTIDDEVRFMTKTKQHEELSE